MLAHMNEGEDESYAGAASSRVAQQLSAEQQQLQSARSDPALMMRLMHASHEAQMAKRQRLSGLMAGSNSRGDDLNHAYTLEQPPMPRDYKRERADRERATDG